MDDKKRISVRVRKKDAYFAHWLYVVKKQDVRGLMGFLIKQLLIHYINYGEIVCVGKIHYSEEEFNNASKVPVISTYVDDSPEILEWLKQLKASKSKMGAVIRDILKLSIEIIPDNEPEWIPSFFDFDLINRKKMSGFAVTSVLEESVQKIPIEKGNIKTLHSGNNTSDSKVPEVTEADKVSDKILLTEEKEEHYHSRAGMVQGIVPENHNREILGTGFRRKKKK